MTSKYCAHPTAKRSSNRYTYQAVPQPLLAVTQPLYQAVTQPLRAVTQPLYQAVPQPLRAVTQPHSGRPTATQRSPNRQLMSRADVAHIFAVAQRRPPRPQHMPASWRLVLMLILLRS